MDSHAIATPDRRLDRARRLLDQDDLGLAQLGAAVGLSPGHLQRKFREQFGLSPAEYRAQRRLQVLKRSLREGQAVTHALYEAGYGSPSRVYEDGAAVGHEEPNDMLDRHRLSGAGIADDDHRFALFHVEGKALQDFFWAERLIDVVEADHGVGIPGRETR